MGSKIMSVSQLRDFLLLVWYALPTRQFKINRICLLRWLSVLCTALSMLIVQTVFGVFHHFELARQLLQRGHLQKIYSTWPWARLKREGLPRELVGTFPWIHTSEMLMQRFGFSNAWVLDQTSYANALTFDPCTSELLRHHKAPDALIGISGSS